MKPKRRRTVAARAALPQGRETPAVGVPSFADILKELIPSRGPIFESEPLAPLDYGKELSMKSEALRRFWKLHELPGSTGDVLASPRPRAYRTTSKRRTVFYNSVLYLMLGEGTPRQQKRAFVESALEPPEHARVYRFLQQKLSEAAFRNVALHLNYLIIRGSYAERALIFNVDALNGPLVRKLKILSGHLQRQQDLVSAVFVYVDPTGSDYYLEARRPQGGLQFKKLFGWDRLAVAFGGCRYRFHPTSFSQVNESMVSVMLENARNLLAPGAEQRLLDLYCGYGLFTLFLGPAYRQTIGIDAEGHSIRAAEANRRYNPGNDRTRFLGRRISGEGLESSLPPAGGPEAIILDPPRQGPEPGVITVLARRAPHKVLHIFCGVDQIPAALEEWRNGGYGVEKVVALDMFAGSANLEVLVLLGPSAG